MKAIYDAHFEFVWRVLRRLGVPNQDVRDALQDVFVVAHQRGGFSPGLAKPTTWLAEIALRAGVVEGTLYSYFDSKQSLLATVVRGFYESLIADTETGLRAIRGAENQLRFLIRRHLDAFQAEPGLCRLVLAEARPDPAFYDQAVLDFIAEETGETR